MKWISFKKKTPEQNQKVLFTFCGLDVDVGVYHYYSGDTLQKQAHKGGLAYFERPGLRVPATHWMALPRLPNILHRAWP